MIGDNVLIFSNTFSILIVFAILISYFIRNLFLSISSDEVISDLSIVENYIKNQDNADFTESETLYLGHNVIYNVYNDSKKTYIH